MRQLHKGWALAMVKDHKNRPMFPAMIWISSKVDGSLIPVFATRKNALAYWRKHGPIPKQEAIVRVEAFAIGPKERP